MQGLGRSGELKTSTGNEEGRKGRGDTVGSVRCVIAGSFPVACTSLEERCALVCDSV